MEMVDAETKRELYVKAKEIAKNAKIHKYLTEKDVICEEGVSFFGYFTGRNSLQYERIRNIKLRIELTHAEKIDDKTDYNVVDTLAYLNTVALDEFCGKLTPEMQDLYNEIRNNYCDDSITDEYIYRLSCERAIKEDKYLPIVHKEKREGAFFERKNQINFYRIENQKLEDLIVKERGKMQFETFSSKPYEIIKPVEKTIKKEEKP